MTVVRPEKKLPGWRVLLEKSGPEKRLEPKIDDVPAGFGAVPKRLVDGGPKRLVDGWPNVPVVSSFGALVCDVKGKSGLSEGNRLNFPGSIPGVPILVSVSVFGMVGVKSLRFEISSGDSLGTLAT